MRVPGSKGSHTAPGKAELTVLLGDRNTLQSTGGAAAEGLHWDTPTHVQILQSFSLGKTETSFHHTVPDSMAQDHIFRVQTNKRIQTHCKCCCWPCWPLHPLGPAKDQNSPPWGPEVPQCPHCLSHVNWVAAPLQEQPELGHRNGNSSFADLLVCVKEALAEQEVSANPDGILPYVPYVRVTEKRVSSRRNGRHWEGFSLFLYKES